jgi:hypothetical protein
MTREQLEHLIRAAASISGEDRIVIIGSQAILGSHPDAPASLLTSMEADAFPEQAPEMSDIIDGCIGELSPFHETYGYYAHGVAPETAILPEGWKARLVEVQSPATYGSVGLCLSPVDLAISKLLAGRDKDIAFVRTMVAEGFVDVGEMLAHENELDNNNAALLEERSRLISSAHS